MKKIILITGIICTTGMVLSAQTGTEANSKFISAMQNNIQQLDTAQAGSSFMLLANNFDRIAEAEKTKWEPYYYAAYCYGLMALNAPDVSKIDLLADKAVGFLSTAAKLQPNNSEISTVFAMIKSAQLAADPMNRWMSLGQAIDTHLADAKKQDPTNPRPYFIEARIKYRTPEGLGGGKEVAKKLLAEGIKKSASFVATSPITPAWGLKNAELFLQKLNTTE